MAVEYVRGYQQGDSLKRVPVHLPDGFPGGDTALGVQKVEQRFAYSVPQVASGVVKSAPGFLHALIFSCNPQPARGALTTQQKAKLLWYVVQRRFEVS